MAFLSTPFRHVRHTPDCRASAARRSRRSRRRVLPASRQGAVEAAAGAFTALACYRPR